MNAAYGAKWRANFPDPESLSIGRFKWGTMLHGLTQNQLRRGVNSSVKLADWNPSISEFLRAACNLPSLEQCFARVMDGENIDQVSYKITAKIGTYKMKTLNFNQIKFSVKSYYDDAYEEVLAQTIGNDEQFKPVVALPKESAVEISRADDATAFSNLRAMRSSLGKDQRQESV